MARIIGVYQRFLRKHPLVVQSIQVGALMGVGDAIAQKAFQKSDPAKPFNFSRNKNFILLGALFVGPGTRTWYVILDKYIKGERTERVLKKVICDQLIFAPFFLATFLMLLETLEKGSIAEARRATRLYYFDLLKANYTIWPLVQLCNFYFVPLNYQTLFVQSVALAWNTFLSYKTHIEK
ncbi:hypothetical protein WA026_000770 [Henosepilachna vigintioctopunctata]|uniref:Mitochondrial inner membrane protein Mpv17 n=1 Tax=Henosepilachna vigintioctopunctata TaxID=420089 RepID=A0AAW1V5Z0_9CUCU